MRHRPPLYTGLVYVAVMDRAWEERTDDDPSPQLVMNNLLPAPLVPRVGDHFHADRRWWRVEVVTWSQIKPEIEARTDALAVEMGDAPKRDYDAWVDLVVSMLDEDPRT